MRFLPVDRKVLEHPIERRGLVEVPLDWERPEGERIELFYRLIPTYGSTPDDASKPVVVVINGGPGISVRFYRPLDYDYTTHTMPGGGVDRFEYLLRTHRVLIIDQRGTDGCSAPIDIDDPGLDATFVARYFSSDSHARDYLAVIDALIPQGERFFVIAQSYGGLPGMQLIAIDQRRPTGIVFSSSALPFEDPNLEARERRREQLRLNLHLREVVPDVEERLAKTRAHYVAVGLEPELIHGLYSLLGKGETGTWESGLVARLDKIQRQSREEILADVEAGLEAPSLLNYILSSVNFSPGQTDRTLAARSAREVPFEPWMIDETVMIMKTGQDGTWRQRFVDAFDAAPPPGTPFPSMDELRAAIGKNQVLFTAADNDAFVPGNAYRDNVARFLVPGHTEVRSLPGGHNAIFLEAGYEAFLAWSKDL